MIRLWLHPDSTSVAFVKLNPILNELGTYPLEEIKSRASALAEAGVDVIDFSIGDPREPTPDFIRQAARDAIPLVSQYPTARGLPELRGAIADYLGRRFDIVVDPSTQVIPTSGSKESIFNTPFAFVRPGDSVAYGTPGYPVYERGSRFAGASVDPIVLSGDFVLRADDVPEPVWDRARMLWTCTPHNPTGAVSSREDLVALVDRARASDTLLCADECYVDVYEGDPPSSTLQVAGPDFDGVLAYFSCSKRSGMTGYRSGAIIGDADGIAALARLRSTTGTASPDFVQLAAAAAWADDDHAAERRAVFAAKRAVLRPAFEDIGIKTVASKAGLYLWLEVEDDLATAHALLEGGVVVSPGRAFGPGGEGFIRLALVPTVEQCEQAVEVVQRCLRTTN